MHPALPHVCLIVASPLYLLSRETFSARIWRLPSVGALQIVVILVCLWEKVSSGSSYSALRLAALGFSYGTWDFHCSMQGLSFGS